jgi:hypothetical protein
MGEDRGKKQARMAMKEAIRGHENTFAHAWDHTGGHCPKCGCKQHMMAYCWPGKSDQPHIPLCEVDGEHVHRVCASCKYPWVERPLDVTRLAEQEGRISAESELAAALAFIVNVNGGVRLPIAGVLSVRGWTIICRRDQEDGTLEITAEPPAEKPGEIHHPTIQTEDPGIAG